RLCGRGHCARGAGQQPGCVQRSRRAELFFGDRRRGAAGLGYFGRCVRVAGYLGAGRRCHAFL
ncbi:hypothetical protein H4S02_002723, partial [Coemansia sp. RSA 2611]